MVEYGHGVGQVSGQGGGPVGGGGGTLGGGTTDLGASVANFVSDSVDRIAALPTETLLVIVVVIFAGVLVLKRAF